MAVSYVPAGKRSVMPCLVVTDGLKMLEFMEKVFHATILDKYMGANDVLMHAEVQIGDCQIMLGTASEHWPATQASLYVYVQDVDAAHQRAIQAGASSIMEPMDQFYGDRHGTVKDPFGNLWSIATHIEDVSCEEMHRRAQEYMTQQIPASTT